MALDSKILNCDPHYRVHLVEAPTGFRIHHIPKWTINHVPLRLRYMDCKNDQAARDPLLIYPCPFSFRKDPFLPTKNSLATELLIISHVQLPDD